MKVISVVRDFAMYDACVKNNSFFTGAELFPFDNRTENKGVSARYNEFLDAYDYSRPDWLMFCHEDWKLLEDYRVRLSELNKETLYGSIGVFVCDNTSTEVRGAIAHSDKDGANKEKAGYAAPTGTPVSTFDCQCLLVHSDLIQKYHLRFDENLLWDLYVEDFCIAAKENHNISSQIVQLACYHLSQGNIQPRFFKKLAYLRQKYRRAKRVYASIIGPSLICGWFLRLKGALGLFFYRKKVSRSGKVIIKICKIPVYRSRQVK